MKLFHPLLPKIFLAPLLLISFLTAPASSFAQVAKRAKSPPVADSGAVDWDQFLIKGEPNPTLRIPAAHQHAATGCYGYLYVTREEIWYEVLAPAKDKDHAFRLPRNTLTDARQWRFMGTTMPEVEFKFSNGKVFHFFRVRQSYLDRADLGTAKFGWDDVVSWEPLAQAATDFDQIVRIAEQRQAALAPKPIPSVSLSVDPPNVEKGHPVTITWSAANATNVDLEPGIGDVPVSGSRTVTPEETTTYVLTAQGPGGGNNTSRSVTVNAPAAPPAIVLVEPALTSSGQLVEVTASPLVIRGIVMDSAGIPVVLINGAPAALRPKSAQAAEFSSDPMVLQPGDNRFEISAVSPSNAEAKVVFLARYAPPAPPPTPPPAPPSNPKALAKADIIQLLNGDVTSARVARLVKERGIKFNPSDDDLNDIRAAGGKNDLIEALRQVAAGQ